MEIPKKYNPQEEEKKWQKFWEDERVYAFDQTSNKEIFSVDTPPPTVSGDMHLGHSFSYAQTDFTSRFQRMNGKNVFYPFGTDDNGLPTERLVEKLKKVKGSKMDRSAFVELCMETVQELRPAFIQDWKVLGISCDFDICYSTIDDNSRKISQESFIDLYEKGREYQKQAPTVWCPTCETAISQAEMEDKELDSYFNDIVFKLEDGSDLIIATTRPELLPGCVAIFAHPDDERYKKLFGKKAKVPLFDLQVEIKPSERADPEKGTGILMCCTFGDKDDIEHYLEHNLDLRVAITKDGKMSDLAGVYAGLPIREARKTIIQDLKDAGLLVGQKKIVHPVNVHERCGTEVEILETKQWFVRYLDLKDDFISYGRKLKWKPDHMRHRYENWVNGLAWDWCISRQRFYGVAFPVWYCKKCEHPKLARREDLPVDPLKDKPYGSCEKCGCDEFVPEKDVLDTWATSSLTPQLARSLVSDHVQEHLQVFDVRPQGHDIISFWLFNTVVKSVLHHERNPWEHVNISGWALDPKGKKMSKSKGNAIAPQKMMDLYGADALRYWAGTSKLGEDVPFQEKEVITGKKLVTKLWNASRFASFHLEDYDGKKNDHLEPMDRWILAEFNEVLRTATEDFSNFDYARARHALDNFFWKKLCDNYLEIVKDRLYNPEKYSTERRHSGQFALYQVFLDVLKCFAPILPFITESVYQYMFKQFSPEVKSIHLGAWPSAEDVDQRDLQDGRVAVEVVGAARRLKAAAQVSLAAPLDKVVVTCSADVQAQIERFVDDIKGGLKAESLTFEEGGKEVAVDGVLVDIVLSGVEES